VAHCAGCHGAAGDGRGILASGLGAPVPDLSTPLSLATRSDADLVTVVSDGTAGTAMPAFGRVLTDDERWKALGFLRLLSLGAVERATEASAAAPAAAMPQADVLAEVRRLLGAAVEAHGRGDAAAADFATDAYLRFEPLEPHLRTRDGEIVPRLEEAFLAFRMAIARPGAGREVTEARARVETDLDRAGTLLASRTDAWARFVQSAAIILREGIEVVLIVGALLAYVRRSGNGAMARAIHAGTGLGIAASVASAALLVGLLRSRPAAAELIEGVAMLVAAGVLFWVSYWIISKAEAERWQRYIQGKVQHAVAAGSGVALAAAAFLAVYREGVETVLFYQALLGSAPAGDLAVGAGFVGGAAVLSVLYVLMSRFGLRIPMRPFFLVTGAFLYAMSVSFAGGGVHALQEAGVIGITPVPWVPTIPFLGVFPALEPLLAQGVLLACLAYAAFVTLRRRPASDQHVVAAELGRLRAQAEAMRAEVAALRAVDGAASQGLDARLEGLIGRVRELEGRLPGNGRG
jgi:high-affinity iron transporter